MADRRIFALNDEFIAQLQNLVVYCMATGTHIADHIRQIRLEESSEKLNTLVLTPEYLEYCEKTVEKLKEDLRSAQEEHQTLLTNEETDN